MTQKSGLWLNRAFVLAFLVLTFFCWCPVGYGSYGPVDRVFGIPSWAAIALALAAVLFVLEWIYLFFTGMAITDEELPGIMSELQKADAGDADSAKEAR